MQTALSPRPFSTRFLALIAVYFCTSLGHFSHNATFIGTYPNRPTWLTSAQVYGAWAAITAVGAAGLVLLRQRFFALGWSAVAVYAALGFDGLGHYALAPIQFHSLGANVSILSQVAAAALLLSTTLWMALKHRARIYKE